MRFYYILLFLCCSSTFFAQQNQTFQVNFAKDASSIENSAQETLKEVLALCQKSANYSIELKGHTDSDGSIGYNQLLSQERCAAVSDWLKINGINVERIHQLSFGEQLPLVENIDEKNMGKNRRVELSMTYQEITSTQDLFNHLAASREQVFTVQGETDEVLTCQDGSVLIIPAHAFQYADGTPCTEAVSLKVDEAVKPSAMIAHRLNTADAMASLSTGGMIRLTATANGEPLELISGKAINVSIPTNDPNLEMQMYRGDRNEVGQMDWETIEAPLKIVDMPPLQNVKVDFPTELLSSLQDLEFDIPQFPGKFKDLNLPALIKKPLPATAQMSKPFRPGKPQLQIAKKPSNIFRRMKYDQEKVQAEFDKNYELRLAKYDQRVIEYQQAMKLYENNQAVIAAEQVIIDKEFEIELRQNHEARRTIINDYLKQCYAYEVATMLQQKIDYFYKDLTPQNLEEKLFPSRAKKQLITSFTFQHSYKGIDLYVEGKKLPYGESPDYYKYFVQVMDMMRDYEDAIGYTRAFSKLKKAYADFKKEQMVQLKEKNNAVFTGLNENIKYYNFNITQPEMTWCNIDTPLPFGQELLVIKNTKFSEVYTFIPERKVVHYFPVGVNASAMYPSRTMVNYLGFKFTDNGIAMANGKIMPEGRDQLTLTYEVADIYKIENALKQLDEKG